ncbi:MAG: hypothetical protein J6S90_09220, partial [Lentisphaeria bacterium]|nr:hypothetical protein [Lentisphaeria bacterium]
CMGSSGKFHPGRRNSPGRRNFPSKKNGNKRVYLQFFVYVSGYSDHSGVVRNVFLHQSFWRVIFISPLFVSAIIFCVKGIKHHLKDYHKDGPLNLVMTPRQRRAYNNIWNCIIYTIFYPLILFAIAWWGLDFIRFIFAPGFWEHLLSIEPFFFLVFTASGGISLGVGLSFWSRRR